MEQENYPTLRYASGEVAMRQLNNTMAAKEKARAIIEIMRASAVASPQIYGEIARCPDPVVQARLQYVADQGLEALATVIRNIPLADMNTTEDTYIHRRQRG